MVRLVWELWLTLEGYADVRQRKRLSFACVCICFAFLAVSCPFFLSSKSANLAQQSAFLAALGLHNFLASLAIQVADSGGFCVFFDVNIPWRLSADRNWDSNCVQSIFSSANACLSSYRQLRHLSLTVEVFRLSLAS